MKAHVAHKVAVLFEAKLTLTTYFLGQKFSSWTKEAQYLLYERNHPLDCANIPILLCSTRVNKFQGTGSRLFFLGRCLTEGLNSNRVVVLSDELMSTHDMLNPFMAWSNCSIKDIRSKSYRSKVKLYYPMDSDSLMKSKDMPCCTISSISLKLGWLSSFQLSVSFSLRMATEAASCKPRDQSSLHCCFQSSLSANSLAKTNGFILVCQNP